MIRFGTRVKVITGEHDGLVGTTAHPLVVELICNRIDKEFDFKEGNCVIVDGMIGCYFWFTDEELEIINA